MRGTESSHVRLITDSPVPRCFDVGRTAAPHSSRFSCCVGGPQAHADSSKKGGSRTSGRSTGDERRREPEHGPPVSADDDLRRSSGWRARACTRRGAGARPAPPGKRGPKTERSDEEVVAAIRAVLAATPFHGEGYRKVRARLAHRGLAVGGKRVLRLMRIHQLLAPRRLGPPNGDPAHAGTIITTRPDEMWGTDATRFYTERGGLVLVLRGHRPLQSTRWWAGTSPRLGDRWAALEPLRQGVRQVVGRASARTWCAE